MKLLPWRRKSRAKAISEPVQFARSLSYQCAAVQGIGSREQQEDDWTLVNASDVTQARKMGILAVVADGMGGMANGALASSTGIRVITNAFQQMNRSMPLERQLTGAIRYAAEAVRSLLHGGGGSTVIACIMHEEQLYYAGVGDSFLYLLRQGTLIRINREQNVLHQRYLEWIRDGIVETSAKQGVSQPHAVTCFLGADPLSDVDCLHRAMPLENGDTLLLCSDGIGGVLSPEEIKMCIGMPDANAGAAALKQAVLSKGRRHQDNFTGIVIRCVK